MLRAFGNSFSHRGTWTTKLAKCLGVAEENFSGSGPYDLTGKLERSGEIISNDIYTFYPGINDVLSAVVTLGAKYEGRCYYLQHEPLPDSDINAVLSGIRITELGDFILDVTSKGSKVVLVTQANVNHIGYAGNIPPKYYPYRDCAGSLLLEKINIYWNNLLDKLASDNPKVLLVDFNAKIESLVANGTPTEELFRGNHPTNKAHEILAGMACDMIKDHGHDDL